MFAAIFIKLLLFWNVILSSNSLITNKLDVKSRSIRPLPDEAASFLLDPVRVNDNEEFELTDIISLSEANIDHDIDRYTDEDRKQYVDLHNIYRSNHTYPIPQASDMKMLEYNKTLEWGAAEYLRECKFAHGRAKVDNMSSFTSQNLYSGPSTLISRYLYLWYMEYPDYNFTEFRCKQAPSGEKKIKCGHFTLMMWGRVSHLGCARRSYCFPRYSLSQVLVACHYYPLGNWHTNDQIYPFSVGVPCTRNEMGDGNLCHKNLCVTKRMCAQYDLDCTCELNCLNCAEPDTKNCRCICKRGWDYGDCGIPCRDQYIEDPKNEVGDKLCPYKVGNMAINHCVDSYFLVHKCRHTCGYCKALSEKDDPKELCCGGKACDRFSVLDVNSCECKRNCPTLGCLYNHTTFTPVSIKHDPSVWSKELLESLKQSVWSSGSCKRLSLVLIVLLFFAFSFA